MNTVRVKASFQFDGWVDVRGQGMTKERAEEIVKKGFEGSLSFTYPRKNVVACSFEDSLKEVTILD